MRSVNNNTGSGRTISVYDNTGAYIYEVGDIIIINNIPYSVEKEFIGGNNIDIQEYCKNYIDVLGENDESIITTKNFVEKFSKFITGLSYNSPILSLDCDTFIEWAENNSGVCGVASTRIEGGDKFKIGEVSANVGDIVIIKKFPFTNGVIMQEMFIINYNDDIGSRDISKYYRAKNNNEDDFTKWKAYKFNNDEEKLLDRINSEIENVNFLRKRIENLLDSSFKVYDLNQFSLSYPEVMAGDSITVIKKDSQSSGIVPPSDTNSMTISGLKIYFSVKDGKRVVSNTSYSGNDILRIIIMK